MQKLPKELLEAKLAYYQGDSVFAANARLLQSLWRENNMYPIQPGKHGNYVELAYAKETGANFLTPTIWGAVQAAVKCKEKLIQSPRIWNNMLSSQPMCFNLFGELQKNLKLATLVLRATLPIEIEQVTGIEFEHSPGRGDTRFTGDNSAFDVFIEYVTPASERGFVGVEVKYSENPLKDDKKAAAATFEKNGESYMALSRQSGLFDAADFEQLKQIPLQQLWRDHLLSIALKIKAPDRYQHGCFVYLYPEGNVECELAIDRYFHTLGEPEATTISLFSIHLEKIVSILSELSNEEWIKRFWKRYLDFLR